MPITTLNPATGETVRTFDTLTADEIHDRLSNAVRAFDSYRLSTLGSRAVCMRNASEILISGKRRYAELMTLEMGKPIGAAVAEVEKCAFLCRYYAEKAPHFLASFAVDTIDGEGAVYFQPLGVILAVMPWNFPFWQVFRFAVPALMAGNTGILKHSSNVPQCALAVEEVFASAGFPDGVFQTLLTGSPAVAGMIADPRIAAVTLTGSENAGRSVAEAAGRNLKKAVLELGGSDPDRKSTRLNS